MLMLGRGDARCTKLNYVV